MKFKKNIPRDLVVVIITNKILANTGFNPRENIFTACSINSMISFWLLYVYISSIGN